MRTITARRVIGIAAFALVFAACGGDDSSSSASDNTTTTAAPHETTTTAAAGDTTLAVADGHLVDAKGMSVYFFEKDQGTTSACMDQCAQAWPAVVASGTPTAGDGVDASKLTTANGQVADQVVYNGHLLYTFSGDNAPGDTNGKSIPSWYLLDAKGEEIEAG
jgi:predicted lipoprotein with Yx(FWY)xxD motif